MENSGNDVASQHLDRALAARDAGDFDTAIAELDACLCANPAPHTAMFAWFELGGAIVFKFDFPHRSGTSISDEEFMWHSRAGICTRNAVEIYEKTISHTNLASKYQKMYEIAKGRANQMMTYGGAKKDAAGNIVLRGLDVFYQVVLPPLPCLAEQERERAEQVRREQQEKKERQQNKPQPKKEKMVEPAKKSGCFIATAAYGSPFAPEVAIFRQFRDEILLASKAGTPFVRVYYFVSPPLASFVSRHQLLRTMTRRVLLAPILRLINK